MVYKKVKVDISEAQLKKALDGKPIRLAATQIGKGTTFLSLHPANAKIVEKAAMANRGCMITLSPGELLSTAEDMEGAGFFSDIWNKLKSSYQWTKKNVIDTPFYQENLRPLVRKGVDMASTYAKAYQPQAANLVDASVNALSSKTGAFGVKSRMSKSDRQKKLAGMGLYLS